MNEIIYNLPENIDTTVFYGINNANIILLKKLFPTVKLVARGHTIKLVGITEEIVLLEKRLKQLAAFCTATNTLTESNITDIVKGHQPTIISLNDTILHGVGGKAIMARSENQKKLVKEFEKNDLLFAIGPAGSGKTYTAIALAVKALKNKEVKKIILSRPAVEAGEKLGFLPGDMKEKIDPYLQPLYDALQDMIPAAKLTDYIAHGIIQIAPLAFMRGRTLSNAVIILDEAQNTSKQQIKMFLTRMGLGSKMIITGDLTQIDLPISQKSGLKDALEILKDVKGISRVEFNQKDIVRHKLVQRIVDAYEQNEEKRP
ncbi:MAG TPA: PhoH family protein [Paludibacteraceae bacterium]|nr:PhoH family protein [Paludibacteraceae bacterium]HOS36871.1 PhoH family protein [Paludibacteraceae bacterium]HPH72480.1 PhoH family protein [Paludibacteraceae bacterium]HPK19852.1 PhoH family protein [Paludibacteraceae bacterium]